MRKILTLLMMLTLAAGAWANEIIIVNFEDGNIPSGWTNSNFEVLANQISGTSGTNGSYCASTGGKTNSTLEYNTKLVGVTSVSVDVAKTTNNTNNSLYIQYSYDNESWVDALQCTINKNVWTTNTYEFEQATNCYVRICWKGTTAVKLIDNITINYVGGNNPPPQTHYSLTLPTDLNGGTVTANVDNLSQIVPGTSVTVTATPNEGYELDYLKKDGEDVSNPYTFSISDNTVITAAFKEATITPPTGDIRYEFVSYEDVQDGDIVIIVDETSKNAMTNNNGTGTAPSVFPVTIQNGVITLEDDTDIKWVIGVNNNIYTFNKQGTDTYLYCINDNNGVRVGTNTDNEFTIVNNFLFNNGKQRYVGVYNNQDWRCYTSINNNIKNCVVKLYKKTTPDIPIEPEIKEISKLSELSTLSENDIFIFTDTVTVIDKEGNHLYIQDETGAALIYGSIDKNYVTTNVIPASWKGKIKTYNNKVEIIPLEGFEDPVTYINNEGQEVILIRNIKALEINSNISDEDALANLYKYCVITNGIFIEPESWDNWNEKIMISDSYGTIQAYMKTLGHEWLDPDTFDFSVPYNIYGILDVYVSNSKTNIVRILPMGVEHNGIVTDNIETIESSIKKVLYYNIQGIESSEPFDGLNIVVTEYENGTKKTNKRIYKF